MQLLGRKQNMRGWKKTWGMPVKSKRIITILKKIKKNKTIKK